MIYKVHVIANRESYGYSYFRTKKDALQFYKAHNNRREKGDPNNCWDEDFYYEAELESFKTPRTTQEIISALNIHGGHEDNG